jgi:hypothetical protein
LLYHSAVLLLYHSAVQDSALTNINLYSHYNA